MENTTEEVPKLEVIFKQEGKEDIVFTLSQQDMASTTSDFSDCEDIIKYLQSFIAYRKALEIVR